MSHSLCALFFLFSYYSPFLFASFICSSVSFFIPEFSLLLSLWLLLLFILTHYPTFSRGVLHVTAWSLSLTLHEIRTPDVLIISLFRCICFLFSCPVSPSPFSSLFVLLFRHFILALRIDLMLRFFISFLVIGTWVLKAEYQGAPGGSSCTHTLEYVNVPYCHRY